MASSSQRDDEVERPWGVLLVGALAGAALVALAIPRWALAMAASLTATDAKGVWYLSRASGLVSYALLWTSVTAGLLSSTGIGPRVSRGPALHHLHRDGAWIGLAFAAFHALVLLADAHVGGDLAAVLVPFAMARHAPGWVALGQLALYGGLLVAISFRFRGALGARSWRALHFASFTVYVLTLAHGLFAGTDAGAPWLLAGFAGSGAIVAMLTAVRLAQARR